MPLFSEFESLYHAMVYSLHDEINDNTKAWHQLSDALDAFGEDQEFLVSHNFKDALLDDSADNFLHLFHELKESDNTYYISKLKSLPYINFSNLEKSYVYYMLSHDKTKAFLSTASINKLKDSLEADTSVLKDFKGHLSHLHKGSIPLDTTDSKHLKILMTCIEQRQKIHYHYIDDEGRVYEGISSPLRLQHDMQSDRLYVIHFPQGYHKPVQGLLRFFSSVEALNDDHYDLKTIEALSPYSIKGSSTVTLSIDSKSPILRKALVELSVFERIITRTEQDDMTLYKIQLTYYSFDKEKLMRKIRLLQPALTVESPITLRKELAEQFTGALKRL